jgi:hypothetical protein
MATQEGTTSADGPHRTPDSTFDCVATSIAVIWSRLPSHRSVGRTADAAWGAVGPHEPRANVGAARTDEGLAQAISRLGDASAAHGVQVHTAAGAGATDGAAVPLLAGYEMVETMQGMVHRDIASVPPPSREHRTVGGTEYGAFCSAAYGLGAGERAPLPADLGPLGAYLLVEERGTPVSCAATVAVGSTCFVFGVATPRELRCEGRGRDATAAALHGSFVHGCRTAVLQSTAAGLALYSQMGFEAVDAWEWWITGPRTGRTTV